MVERLSAASLDYLQRAGVPRCPLPAPSADTAIPISRRRLFRIEGVGVLQRGRTPPTPGVEPRPPDAGLLLGLFGDKIPLAFLVTGDPSGIALSLGTWCRPNDVAKEALSGVLDAREGILAAILGSLHPEVFRGDTIPQPPLPRGGVALGVPTMFPPDPRDGSVSIDRLIRAMTGATWAALVLAEPVDEQFTARLRQTLLAELRAVQTEAADSGAPSPLSKHYSELLEAQLVRLTRGVALGAWRVGAYLSGDGASYHRLAGAWRSVYGGPQSLPESVETWESPEAAGLVAAWAMPYAPAAQAPGGYRHPFEHQTLLTSTELATIVQLPQVETSGFALRLVPEFDVAVPRRAPGTGTIGLGMVVDRGRATASLYEIAYASLTKHALVAGITGSGKTNSVFRILRAATDAGIPFLVLEPAKTEYRSLLHDRLLAEPVRVFTAGNEGVAPLRINPLEALPGTTVAQHLDLLRSVFSASFGMWTPLPQVLERCLHEVYAAYGWDLVLNANRRLGSSDDWSPSYPTLSDLAAKVEEVVPKLGYEDRLTSDIGAALLTRLDGLRRGGKGRMFDVQRSLAMDEILGGPAVVELEWMGDDDDKAFLMALLLVRLYEHRRAQGETSELQHLLVIEEAHRLLSAAAPGRSEEQADPQRKAVETFAQLLSEIRAYGQGVVIADQIPVRLASDVLKNTALKVAHRTVAAEDRAALAGAMGMDERQARSLAALDVFEAAVFGDGDDAPVLVRVPFAKGATRPADDEVATVMATLAPEGTAESFCVETCADMVVCDAARRLALDAVVQRTVSRLVLSTIEEIGALDRLWDELIDVVRARAPAGIEEYALLRAVCGHASDVLARRRSAQASWSFAVAADLSLAVRSTMLEKLDGGPRASASPARARLQSLLTRVATRTFPPYPSCDAVCNQSASAALCLYRQAIADVILSRQHQLAWEQAEQRDAESVDLRSIQAWQVCLDAGADAVEALSESTPEGVRVTVWGALTRASLCFAQQMLASDATKTPAVVRRAFADILQEVEP